MPGPTTNVVFAATTSGSLATNLETNYSINSLTVLGTGSGSPTTSGVVTVGGGSSGPLTINAANNSSGENYTAGTGIVIQSGAAGLTISTAGGVTVPVSQSWTNSSVTGPFSVSSTVRGSASPSTPVTLTLIDAGGGTTISGVVSDGTGTGSPLNLVVSDTATGVTTLSNANTYSGGTTINSGTLRIGNPTALSTGAVRVVSGGALDLRGTTMTGTNALTLNGTGISSGGALTNSSATAGTYAGLVTLGSSGVSIGGTGTIALSNTGTITGSGYNLTLGGAGGSIAGVIGTGAGTVTVSSTGTWTSNSANTFTGMLAINSGTFATTNIQTTGTAQGMGAGSSLAINGGTFEYIGTSAAGGANPSSWTPSLTVGTNGATLYDAASSGNYVGYNGVITGSGTLTFLSTPTGFNNSQWFVQANSPSFSGNVVIGTNAVTTYGNGIVQYRSSAADPFGIGGTITINASGLLAADNGSTNPVQLANNIVLNGGILGNQYAGAFSYTGGITLNPSTTSTLWNSGGNLTLSGAISGSGALNVGVSGQTNNTVILTNTDSYSGATTVAYGTLQIGNVTTAGAITNSSVTINSGTTLAFAGPTTSTTTFNGSVSGSGTMAINRGAVSFGGAIGSTPVVFNGGTLSYTPSSSNELFASNVTFNSGASTISVVTGSYNQLVSERQFIHAQHRRHGELQSIRHQQRELRAAIPPAMAAESSLPGCFIREPATPQFRHTPAAASGNITPRTMPQILPP